MQTQKLSAAIAETLMDQGVSTMFGLLGDGNMEYLAHYVDHCGGRYVGAVDERFAVSMADGFSRATQGVGVASVTHGPGLTNALTSLTEAAHARVPLVLLTADPPASKPYHHQRVDTEAFVRPTGAVYRCALTADHAVDELGRSIRQASVESRPVVFNIPAQLLEEQVETTTTKYTVAPRRVVRPDEDALDGAAGIVATCRSPVLLAGRGAITADAGGALAKLSEFLQAPLATTVPARNLFRGHPLDLGIMGGLSHEVASDVISNADAIIAFGASLNKRTTEAGRLLNGKAVVQVGNDAARLDAFYKSDVPVCGDAHATATSLTAMLDEAGLRAAPRSDDLEARLASWVEDHSGIRTAPGTVDSRVAADRISRLLPTEYGLVTDGGRQNRAVWKYLNGAPPAADVQTNNFGSIGLGLGTAIGVSIARPDLVTVTTTGDGGGMMGFKEFATATRLGLPLAVIVFNDSCYGAEFPKLLEAGADPGVARMEWPSFAEMGVAMGGRGYRVSSPEDIDALGTKVFEPANLPAVIEVITDPTIDLRP